MESTSLKKKSKPDTITAARVPSEVLDILKQNNINVSKAIRMHLCDLASDIIRPKKRKGA